MKIPARLREMVTSPNGTTVAGLRALESGGLVRALVAAVESATQRSRELGREAEERLTKPKWSGCGESSPGSRSMQNKCPRGGAGGGTASLHADMFS